MVSKEPLAYRMSPRNIEEFAGQQHIVGKDKLLYRMIKADRLGSVLLYGPPGTGKTSLARIIANTTQTPFEKINAVTAGVADIKRVVGDALNPLLNPKGRVVLFVDEIHRFNKSQQDALLPYVENGTVVLIGATTENPFFEVNKALISRSQVFMLKPLESEDVRQLLRRALEDNERGLGMYHAEMEEEALLHLAEVSGGDARIALTALELAVTTSDVTADGKIKVTLDVIEDCVQRKAIRFDKTGEDHYDTISAFIKSMRGSDPDATVHYLARALYAGEDVEFLARRIAICASEDVGLANPQALTMAMSAWEAVRKIGMPEARIILADAAVYVAISPKSNAAYMAINEALDDVEKKRTGEIPMHLRNAPARGMKDLGYGEGYQYAHQFEGNWVAQNYMPEALRGKYYYRPYPSGQEAKIGELLEKRRAAVRAREDKK